jgi:3-hydroxybutyryl-CoA dehydrogenase
MEYKVIKLGDSNSFPGTHALIDNASRRGEVALVIGDRIDEGLAGLGDLSDYKAVVIELGTECLGVYTGEARGEEGSNVLGFARFRFGRRALELVELVVNGYRNRRRAKSVRVRRPPGRALQGRARPNHRSSGATLL